MLVTIKWSRRKSKWGIYGPENALGYASHVALADATLGPTTITGRIKSASGVEYTHVGRYQLKPVLENTNVE